MKRSLRIGSMALAAMIAVAPTSFAWVRGGFGFRGGGARISLGLGPVWGPYAYPYYGYAGGYEEQEAYPVPEPSPAPVVSGVQGILDEISRQRAQIKYRYSDGEINRYDRDQTLNQLESIEREARAEADAQGGRLTINQENEFRQSLGMDPLPTENNTRSVAAEEAESSDVGPDLRPRQSVQRINDLMLELRTLLDQKLKDREITESQRANELRDLSAVAHQVRRAIDSRGTLPAADEDQFINQLHEAYYNIVHNFLPE